MKTITGKGLTYPPDATGNPWLAVVPDDATSSQDPRGRKIIAPDGFSIYYDVGASSLQAAWLEGFAAAIKDVQKHGQP
jgi:hypothetical protein